nr:hypothetical protein [Escherichia coli]
MTIEISNQLSEVLSVIERHLESTLLAVHLYGSAVDGGLKPYSDIDLLVTVAVKLDETTRRALLNDLMEASAFPGESETLRAIEVTLVVHDDIIPWRYPAKRELQFGEWQRNDILAGIFEPAMIDIDLAILLTKAREHGTVAKLAMRQPFVLFKGLTFQKLCLPGAFRPGDHHNKMLRPGLCVVHASPQYL